MSTAKAPAAPSGRICEKCRKSKNISTCNYRHIDGNDTMNPCIKFEENLMIGNMI